MLKWFKSSKRKIFLLVALVALSTGTFACSACSSMSTTEKLGLPPLETVEKVELKRYLGTWYEIASYPNSFQKGCTATSATYRLDEDGDIRVVNRCRRGSLDGEMDEAQGFAKIVDRETNAKLKVTFFWPFFGDYWIIGLADDYSWAVVGEPDRDYLWILSRTRQMDPMRYGAALKAIEEQGYPIDRLRRTQQPKGVE